MNWFKRKKVNPLKSDVEWAADEVTGVLKNNYNECTYKEILNVVLSRVLPGTSVHGKPYSKNPKSIYKGKVPFGITSRGNLESEG